MICNFMIFLEYVGSRALLSAKPRRQNGVDPCKSRKTKFLRDFLLPISEAEGGSESRCRSGYGACRDYQKLAEKRMKVRCGKISYGRRDVGKSIERFYSEGQNAREYPESPDSLMPLSLCPKSWRNAPVWDRCAERYTRCTIRSIGSGFYGTGERGI